MRSYEETRSRIHSIEEAIVEIRENFSFEQAFCLMSDTPWSEYRVLLTTRDRVLRAADQAVFSACGANLAALLVDADTLTEATVWQAACKELDTKRLFCAWPVNDTGQAEFLSAITGLTVESEAQLLVKSVPRAQNSGRAWKSYESERLKRLFRG